MSPRWLTAPEVNLLIDHRLRIHQMQIVEATLHSDIATVTAIYEASRLTPPIRTYHHLLASRGHAR